MIATVDNATRDTIAMYNRIPDTFAGHFSNFRSTVPDINRAHELAGVPLGKSRVVEIGCGDGRDAENTFVPRAEAYVGYDPSEGMLKLARERFPETRLDMFRFGYAQATTYPEGTDIIMSVNSILHIPFDDLTETFKRVSTGLRYGGVFYIITKTQSPSNKEVYHDNFEGVVGERTFYHHSVASLTDEAEEAGMIAVYKEITQVAEKPWDWLTIAYQK